MAAMMLMPINYNHAQVFEGCTLFYSLAVFTWIRFSVLLYNIVHIHIPIVVHFKSLYL